MLCIEIFMLQCCGLTTKTTDKFTKVYNTVIISDEKRTHINR